MRRSVLNPYGYTPPFAARPCLKPACDPPVPEDLTEFESLSLAMEGVPGFQSKAMIEARERAKKKVEANK